MEIISKQWILECGHLLLAQIIPANSYLYDTERDRHTLIPMGAVYSWISGSAKKGLCCDFRYCCGGHASMRTTSLWFIRTEGSLSVRCCICKDWDTFQFLPIVCCEPRESIILGNLDTCTLEGFLQCFVVWGFVYGFVVFIEREGWGEQQEGCAETRLLAYFIKHQFY